MENRDRLIFVCVALGILAVGLTLTSIQNTEYDFGNESEQLDAKDKSCQQLGEAENSSLYYDEERKVSQLL